MVIRFNAELAAVRRQKILYSDGEFHEDYSGYVSICQDESGGVRGSYRIPMFFGPAWSLLREEH
jgi:hypothetical protein